MIRGAAGAVRNATDNDRVAEDRVGVKALHQIKLVQIGMEPPFGDPFRSEVSEIRIIALEDPRPIGVDHQERQGRQVRPGGDRHHDRARRT